MVKLKDIVDNFNLQLINDCEEIQEKVNKTQLVVPDINRFSLQLTGNFDFFDEKRIQIIGMLEHSTILKMTEKERYGIFDRAFSFNLPAFIICRDLPDIKEIVEMAKKHKVPLFKTARATTEFKGELIRVLREHFAPIETQHGVLIDIYGEGVLIIGESGIGKSETALELIKRGHRMVADDAVKIKKISQTYLEGTAPEIIRYFMELRGIGIIDVREMFGVESVKETQKIDLVIKLLHWDRKIQFDRLGLEDKYYEIMDVKVPCHEIPIRPGRNLAMICEVAAINCRKKKMGYNAAQVLNDRVLSSISKGKEENENV